MGRAGGLEQAFADMEGAAEAGGGPGTTGGA